MTCFFSHSKIENEIKKKGNKYRYFLKLAKRLMKRIEDLLISCHIFHYFDFFPFHVIYSINEIMLLLKRRKKSKQWMICNKLKMQCPISQLRFSQRIFNHFLVNKVLPVLIFFFDLKLK